MTMNTRKYVESLDLVDGQTHRGDCPACGGKGVFTATKELGELKYNCYKLGCGTKGLYHTDMTAQEIMDVMRRRKENSIAYAQTEKDTMEIPVYVVTPTAEHAKFNRFVMRWGIPRQGLLYDVKDERVVFPIYHKGRIIDANGRAVGGKIPKWYRYSGAADYALYGNGDHLLIVEDILSAIIASIEIPNVTTMAILGTKMSTKHIEKAGEYSTIGVALDPDAIKETIKIKRELELWTGNTVFAITLTDDIKYRNEEDLERVKELLS